MITSPVTAALHEMQTPVQRCGPALRYDYVAPLPHAILSNSLTSTTIHVPRRRCKDSSQTACKSAADSKGRVLEKLVKQDTRWKAKLPPFLTAMFATGAVLGPLLDGIHGRVHLLTYDSGQFDLGGVESSGWVALLLGTFYAVIGGLHVLGDLWQSSAETQNKLYAKRTVPFVLASIGTTALLLHTSAVLYENNVPYIQIAAALFALASVNFKLFEDTRQGLALAILCACAAPLSELVIMNVFGLWHYPHPDAFQQLGRGLPSWVSMCYFFYTPAVGNLARLIWKQL